MNSLSVRYEVSSSDGSEGNMSRKGHKGALLKEEGATPTLHDLVYSIMSKPDLMFSSISDSCT